jgi:nicotinamidase-related amidase
MLVEASDSVLVLVDLQERLAGAMEPAVFQAVSKNAAALLEAARALQIPVLATEQYPKGLGRTVAALSGLLASAPLEKTCFSCAGDQAFLSALDGSGRGHVVIAGMEAHVCVLQSALQLRAAGRAVFVVEDACCSRRAANHANAMNRLRAAGVVVTNTESVLFEWLRDARHAQFKAISALIR